MTAHEPVRPTGKSSSVRLRGNSRTVHGYAIKFRGVFLARVPFASSRRLLTPLNIVPHAEQRI